LITGAASSPLLLRQQAALGLAESELGGITGDAGWASQVTSLYSAELKGALQLLMNRYG